MTPETEIVNDLKFGHTNFDMLIHLDAANANILQLSELIHAKKAIFFKTPKDTLKHAVDIRMIDLADLERRFGTELNQFGEKYLNLSLFDLAANSIAWESEVWLPHIAEKSQNTGLQKDMTQKDDIIRNIVVNDIVTAIKQMNYDVQLNVRTDGRPVDLMIGSDANYVAIQLLGQEPLSKERIDQKIENLVQLKSQNVNTYTLNALDFYLNPKDVLRQLHEHLAKYEIYPGTH